MRTLKEKYPNVILTSGLLDFVQCGLTDPKKDNVDKKLQVISQIFDEDDNLEDFDREKPIGKEEDPWEDQLTKKDIPENILKKLQEDGTTINDLLNEEPMDEELEENLDKDLNAVPFKDEESEETGTWQEELRKFFENSK